MAETYNWEGKLICLVQQYNHIYNSASKDHENTEIVANFLLFNLGWSKLNIAEAIAAKIMLEKGILYIALRVILEKSLFLIPWCERSTYSLFLIPYSLFLIPYSLFHGGNRALLLLSDITQLSNKKLLL